VNRFLSVLAAAAVFAGLSQAASVAKPVNVAPPPKSLAKMTPAKTFPDAQIQHDILAKFAKSKINAEHFTASVRNGVATLEGKTNVIQHKGVATRIAKKSGAIAVENHIQVSEEAKAKAAATLAKNKGEGPPARAVIVPAARPK
jgi:osmotically-inducible protein OsmY